MKIKDDPAGDFTRKYCSSCITLGCFTEKGKWARCYDNKGADYTPKEATKK